MRKIITGTITTLLVVAAVAVGFYLLLEGSGSNSQKLGTATLEKFTVTAEFAAGLKPGGNESVEYKVHNPLTHAITVKKITWLPIKTSAVGCEPSWFSLTGADAIFNGEGLVEAESIPAGKEGKVHTAKLEFLETGTNQNACEGAEVTLAETAK